MKSRSPNPRRRGGFSLIELLIASTLIAAAGGLLMGGLIAANRSSSVRDEQALLGQLLASQLALLDDPLPAGLPASGALPDPFGEYALAVAMEPVPLTTLQQAALTIRHGAHRVDVVTWRRTPDDDAQP